MLNAIPSLREESRSRAVLRNPKYVAAAALVAATTFALYRFLATPGGLHDGDLSFPITAAAHLREHYPIWSLMGFGNEPVAARLFFHIPFVLIAELLSLDGGAYAKLIITSSVVGAGLAAYAAARIVAQLYMPRRCAAYPWSTAAGAALCGFFYALNPWSLAQLEHFHIVAGLAPAPLIFALLLRGLMLGHHRSVVLAALAAALVGSITPHTAIVTLSLVVAVTVFHVAVGFYPAALAARLRVAMTAAALFASVYIPTAAFGWLPVLLNVLAEGPPIPIYIIVDQDLRLLASNQTWLNTVRLVGNWYWSQTLRPAEGASAEWNVISLIPLATLVAGSVAIRTLWRPIVFLLAIGSVAAVLVSAFASPPFDEALRGAVSELPFGWLIREPDRGSWFLVLAYSLGTGLISIYLLSAVAKHYGGGIGLNRWMTTWMLMFAVIASILVGYTVPAIRGVLWDRNTALQPQVEPRAYLAAEYGLRIEPLLTAGISNGYPIPAVGDAIVTIEYGGQIAYDAGIAISGITGLAAVGYVVVKRPGALARGVLTAARLIATRSAVWLGKGPYGQARDIWLLIAISPAAARNALAMSLSMAISQIQAARSRIARWASGQWNRGGRFVGRLSSRSRALARATSAAIWSVCVRTSIAALNSFWIKSPPGVGRVYAAIIRVSVAIGRLAILLAVVLLPTAASFAISGSPELANTLVTVALASVVGAIVMFVMGRYNDQARDATTDNPD